METKSLSFEQMKELQGGGWWNCTKTIFYVGTGAVAVVASEGTLALILAGLGYYDAITDLGPNCFDLVE